MAVDVFGRRRNKNIESIRGPPGIGFKINNEGQFDIENKRISNLAPPIQPGDAVNLHSLHQIIQEEKKQIKKEFEELLSTFKLDSEVKEKKKKKNGANSK